jgi:hypothetical protein
MYAEKIEIKTNRNISKELARLCAPTPMAIRKTKMIIAGNDGNNNQSDSLPFRWRDIFQAGTHKRKRLRKNIVDNNSIIYLPHVEPNSVYPGQHKNSYAEGNVGEYACSYISTFYHNVLKRAMLCCF